MRTTKNKNTEKIKIMISPDIKKEFQEICDSEETTMSAKIKQFIVKDIKRYRKLNNENKQE
jgi:deoxyribodipyrimidine photolyase